MKLLIVGGVAGGASCATRARRMSEEAEIVILERGPFVSFANCGLPYYVGDVVEDEQDLVIATPERFRERFKINVRLEQEVLKIDRKKKELEIRDLRKGRSYTESYDALVLSPGAFPVKPPLPGVDLPGIFTLRTIPDSRLIKEWIKERNARSAVVVGGGYIGLEMAENLGHLGLKTTILEMQPQVLPLFDLEMMPRIHEHLRAKGVELILAEAVSGFESANGKLVVKSASGRRVEADLVILSIGVKPEAKLAKEAGLEIGPRGGIKVSEYLQTSDPAIWAVGDAIEVCDFVTHEPALIALAGPANRQGRIAADNIFGRKARFRGTQGTSVCKVFDFAAATTGAQEKTLKRLKIAHEKVYLYPNDHASYYPGAKQIDLKLIFSPEDGRILGAQAVGEAGVEKRIDVIATAIQMKATVFDLEETELAYAPPFGSAKDPVNIVGMIAANALRGDAPLAHWENIDPKKDFVLDVRTLREFEQGHVEGAVHIPIEQLRSEMEKLPKARAIHVYCGVGQRGHNATRILRLNGFDTRNISGGFKSYRRIKGLT